MIFVFFCLLVMLKFELIFFLDYDFLEKNGVVFFFLCVNSYYLVVKCDY